MKKITIHGRGGQGSLVLAQFMAIAASEDGKFGQAFPFLGVGGELMKITKGAVVTGGTSLGYKTGDWRDQRPILDQALCKACGLCEEDCPDGAIRVEEEIFSIDYDFCKGCGICAHECPTEAIKMIPEEK